MRNLLGPQSGSTVDHAGLVAAYEYPEKPWLRANMVASADGSARGPQGRSAGLSSPADKRIFGLLRGLADVVLVGAGTVREEGYRPARPKPDLVALRARRGQPPAPTIAVVSGSLALDEHSSLFTDNPSRPVVITCAAADPSRLRAMHAVADVVIAGDTRVDGGQARQALQTRGFRRMLTEGGPRLLGDLLSAGALDELCLSYSPHLVGGPSGRIVESAGMDVHMTLEGLLEEDGMLFARYVLPRVPN